MSDPKKPLFPVDPFEGIPSLRAPRVPSIDHHAETIPAPPNFTESGDRDLSDSAEILLSENTTTQTPSTKQLLAQTLEAARSAANEAIATRTEVRHLRNDFQRLDKRVTSLELSQRWAPMLLAALAISLSVWQAFELQSLRAQLQLIRVTYTHGTRETITAAR